MNSYFSPSHSQLSKPLKEPSFWRRHPRLCAVGKVTLGFFGAVASCMTIISFTMRHPHEYAVIAIAVPLAVLSLFLLIALVIYIRDLRCIAKYQYVDIMVLKSAFLPDIVSYFDDTSRYLREVSKRNHLLYKVLLAEYFHRFISKGFDDYLNHI